MIVAQLKDFAAVTGGWLGVQIQQITPEIADNLGLRADGGTSRRESTRYEAGDEPPPFCPLTARNMAASVT